MRLRTHGRLTPTHIEALHLQQAQIHATLTKKSRERSELEVFNNFEHLLPHAANRT